MGDGKSGTLVSMRKDDGGTPGVADAGLKNGEKEANVPMAIATP